MGELKLQCQSTPALGHGAERGGGGAASKFPKASPWRAGRHQVTHQPRVTVAVSTQLPGVAGKRRAKRSIGRSHFSYSQQVLGTNLAIGENVKTMNYNPDSSSILHIWLIFKKMTK